MVTRYDFEPGDCQYNPPKMEKNANGDYVKYEDYGALEDRLHTLEKELATIKDKIHDLWINT